MSTLLRRARPAALGVVAVAALLTSCIPPEQPPTTTTPPPDPSLDRLVPITVIDGFDAATNMEFAPDGRLFVAEKAGVLETFDSIEDTTPTVTADLRAEVRSVGDHGLLGLAVDPQYPARPFVYLLFTWDSTGLWGDGCADYTFNGCATGVRLGRIEVDPATGTMVGGPETTPIVDDRWCFQFASHGSGDLVFLEDGTLVASAGEGANWDGADYGQHGGFVSFPPPSTISPRNPCDDPPGGVGGPMSPATGEGGAFRAQDVLTGDDPTTWAGSIVRIDPDTGQAPADNPLVGVGSADDDAIIAHGNRNPFRMTVDPASGDVFAVDVGFGRYEEVNRVDPTASTVPNLGWPCREGPEVQLTYAALGNAMCQTVEDGSGLTETTDPWFAYGRVGGAAVSAIAVIPPGRYPSELDGTLMISDYVRQLTWSLAIEPDGSADPDGLVQLASEGIIVELEAGPDGYVYGIDYAAGRIVRFVDRAKVPVARLSAEPVAGSTPLTVELDASGSSQAGGGSLDFEWDLDGDGGFDDATGPTTTLVLDEATNRTVTVRVTNADGASSTASIDLFPGNTAPEVAIEVTSPLPWAAADDITFQITATDAEDGVLAPEAVSWSADIVHCYEPDDCHDHPYTEATGSLGDTIEGPSHGYPSFLRLSATAADSRGQLTRTELDLHPATVTLQVTSDPPGATVAVGDEQLVTPFSYTAVKHHRLSLSVPEPQLIGGVEHTFSTWGHTAERAHQYEAADDAALHVTMSPP